MKILIVAATPMEVKLLIDEFAFVGKKNEFLWQYKFANTEIDLLLSGIGVTFTTFRLTQTLTNNSYNLILNIGIAGSLTHELKIGEIVNIVSEEFADLGIEKPDEFLTLFDAGFIEKNDYPFENGILKATNGIDFNGLKKVCGITTNKSHGRKSSIDEICQNFSADVESMEGAAVFYVCNNMGVSCNQIRAISNFVEPRDSSKWNIPLALENLKEVILAVLKKLSVPVN